MPNAESILHIQTYTQTHTYNTEASKQGQRMHTPYILCVIQSVSYRLQSDIVEKLFFFFAFVKWYCTNENLFSFHRTVIGHFYFKHLMQQQKKNAHILN